MDENVIWWGWIIAGTAFLLIELLSTTFFGLWMAIASAIPATLSFLFPKMSLGSQISTWIIAMLICAYLWMRISKKNISNHPYEDSVIGEIGILSRGSSSENPGLLILQKPVEGRSEWKCVSKDEITRDSRVVVTDRISPELLQVVIINSSNV